MIQTGGVYTTFCQDEGIFLRKYRDRNGRCIALPFTSVGVRGRFDSPASLRKTRSFADYFSAFGVASASKPRYHTRRHVNQIDSQSHFPVM